MGTRDPFKFYGLTRRLDTLFGALKEGLQRPYISVTQGGSSRKDRGAKVAATNVKPRSRWNARDTSD